MQVRPLSKTLHSQKVLVHKRDYSFIKGQLLVELCAFEIQEAIQNMPIFFAKNKGKVRAYGVMGVEPEDNLFLNSNGEWRIRFMPASLQVLPFRTGKTQDGENIVLVMEELNFLSDLNVGGEAVFNEDGTHSDTLEKYIQLLYKIEQNIPIMENACSKLLDLGLLEPFEFKINKFGKRIDGPSGLLKIKLKEFNELKPKQFLELRGTNDLGSLQALDLVYAHLFSMSCMQQLALAMEMNEKARSSLQELGSQIFFENEELDFTGKE